VCVSGERITTRRGGYYRCNACREDFTVRTGTIFERSHVPLHKWLYAMYLLVTARKGISSVLKRGILGVYHHTSEKHLGRYVDEFAFRLNEGNVSRHTIERLDSLVLASAGKRLTYQGLIQ
jgi:transposase-like protein